jgi:hypothetical protein
VSHWFDTRAAKPATLTPDQRRKVDAIKQALGESSKQLHVLLHGVSLADDSAAHFGPQPSFGGHLFSTTTLKFRAQLAAELRRASTRLAALHTGLLAEKQLRSSLQASAVAADAWYRALSTDDGATIFREQTAMTAAFAKADKLHKAGLANLELGR